MLQSYPKQVVVKGGTRVILRPMVKEDRDKLKAFFREIPFEDRWYLKEDVADPAVIDSWVDHLDYDRVLPILAEVDGRIVADATLHRRTFGALKGTAKIRVVVGPEYRRRGLGTWMILDILNIAMLGGVERLMAELVAGKEEAALRATEQFGFVREGVIRGGARDPEGNPYDLVIMVKSFPQKWGDF
jgi:RimJ/RimL family protein N-acetyltransferase